MNALITIAESMAGCLLALAVLTAGASVAAKKKAAKGRAMMMAAAEQRQAARTPGSGAMAIPRGKRR